MVQAQALRGPVEKLCPKERYPHSVRVALESLMVASYTPENIVEKYCTGKFHPGERLVTLDGVPNVSFKKALPIFAARIVLKLAEKNGLTVPKWNPNAGDGGASTSAAAAAAATEAVSAVTDHARMGKRGREDDHEVIVESLTHLYDGEDGDAELIPDCDAAAVVEHVVQSNAMARGWEPHLWTQEHITDLQSLAYKTRPASPALQESLVRQCIRCGPRSL